MHCLPTYLYFVSHNRKCTFRDGRLVSARVKSCPPPGPRGQEGRSPRCSSNMAGFAADVMCSCSRSRWAADSPSLLGPGYDEKKAKRCGREFRLSRAKSRSNAENQQHQPASINNNTPLMIRCQVGRELKHVCSSCPGTGPLAGKTTRFGSVRRETAHRPDKAWSSPGKARCLSGQSAPLDRERWWSDPSGPGWGSGPPSVWEYETSEPLTIDLFFVCIRCIRLLNYGRPPLISDQLINCNVTLRVGW